MEAEMTSPSFVTCPACGSKEIPTFSGQCPGCDRSLTDTSAAATVEPHRAGCSHGDAKLPGFLAASQEGRECTLSSGVWLARSSSPRPWSNVAVAMPVPFSTVSRMPCMITAVGDDASRLVPCLGAIPEGVETAEGAPRLALDAGGTCQEGLGGAAQDRSSHPASLRTQPATRSSVRTPLPGKRRSRANRPQQG